MEIFVCFIAQASPDDFHNALLNNEKEFLGQLAESVNRADDLFKKWAVASLGRSIFVNGGFGCVCVPSDKAVEIPKIKGEIETLVGTCAIGVGTEIREAWVACELAMVNGGGKLLLYEPGFEEKLEEADEESDHAIIKREKAKLFEDLNKEEKNSLKPDKENNDKDPKAPEGETPKPLQEQPEQPEPPAGPELQQQDPGPMQMIVEALAQVKQHAATIEKLKTADPRAYEAVKNIVSAMIVMAQNMAESAAQAAPPVEADTGAAPQPPAQSSEAGGGENVGPGMPEGAPAAKSELEKGVFHDVYAGAHNGAMQGMHVSHARSAGDPKAVVTGGALGALKGAANAVMPHVKQKIKLGKDEVNEDLDKAGKPGRYSTVPTTSQARIKRPTRRRGRGPRRRLPIGTIKGNKVKVKDPATGKSKWVSPK